MTDTKKKRLSHGARTRMDILEAAESLATREGLEGLTIGRLADEVGMSKGGVYAHFGSKEALQLATIAAAFERFSAEVFAPAMERPKGIARLQAAFDHYLAYVERRLPSGGCFFTAASLEMDDRPGEVRERIADVLRARDAQILSSIKDAIKASEIRRGVDAEQLTFELVSLSIGAVTTLQMSKDVKALKRARAAFDRWLKSVAPQQTR